MQKLISRAKGYFLEMEVNGLANRVILSGSLILLLSLVTDMAQIQSIRRGSKS